MAARQKVRPANANPPPRRSQAQRSKLTREKIIAAAFDLLHRNGYAGASTMAITKAAGISLGALQHQFPSKALLMAAVARRFAAMRFLTYRAALRGQPPGIARFEAISRASWSLIGTRELAASMEIELAMRNDPELAAAVAPTLARHSAFVTRLMSRILKGHLASNDPRVESLRILNNAIMFGLSVETIRQTDKRTIEAALRTWKDLLLATVKQSSVKHKKQR
jgi:AcrR family transcriptional regulator